MSYIPLQQHLSTSFFASLQNNLPFFCCSQQHVFTSLPVSVHVIFGEAANPTPAITVITARGSHLVIVFMNFTSSPVTFSFYNGSHVQGRTRLSKISASSFEKFRDYKDRRDDQKNTNRYPNPHRTTHHHDPSPTFRLRHTTSSVVATTGWAWRRVEAMNSKSSVTRK